MLGSTDGTPVEIWFQDKARVGQKGGHAYIWAEVGSRPLMVRDTAIRRVRDATAEITGAISQQSETTRDIARSVQFASTATARAGRF